MRPLTKIDWRIFISNQIRPVEIIIKFMNNIALVSGIFWLIYLKAWLVLVVSIVGVFTAGLIAGLLLAILRLPMSIMSSFIMKGKISSYSPSWTLKTFFSTYWLSVIIFNLHGVMWGTSTIAIFSSISDEINLVPALLVAYSIGTKPFREFAKKFNPLTNAIMLIYPFYFCLAFIISIILYIVFENILLCLGILLLQKAFTMVVERKVFGDFSYKKIYEMTD